MKTFPDRFSKEYLKFLQTQLSLENLIATADFEPYDDVTRKKSKKCITINFCGLAANTLLGNAIGRGCEENKDILLLKNSIAQSFKDLFNEGNLAILDKNNLYLRIRFCFSYLYSDFPVCLIKAANDDNWKYIGEGMKYDFYYNQPITKVLLEKSRIYKDQQESLQTIANIIKDNPNIDNLMNPNLIEREKVKHQLQIRFSVIPSPICVLVINNIICCDSYLYAMFPKKHEGLSLRYPISILYNTDDKQQFDSVSKHFKYLWRHDLTLFCGDGTEFDGKNYDKLSSIRDPNKIVWTDKETRIRRSKLRNSENLPTDNEKIEKWEKNLSEKFRLFTSKVILAGANDQIEEFHDQKDRLILTEEEWKKHLAMLNSKRNVLERRLRHIVVDFISYDCLSDKNKVRTKDRILNIIDTPKRSLFTDLSPEQSIEKFLWSDLTKLIVNEWSLFEKLFGDLTEFKFHARITNKRTDAHAKSADLADIALERNSYIWFEDRLREKG